MEYFKRLAELMKIEKDEDRRSFQALAESVPLTERRANGLAWYPIAIRDTEMTRGDYLVVEVERTTNQDLVHQFRFGASVALFSNHDAKADRIEGVIAHLSGNRMKITLRTDELPDWCRDGKLGVDAVFDEASYSEMEQALRIATTVSEKRDEGRLIRILTGMEAPTFNERQQSLPYSRLNEKQAEAAQRILAANELAIVHGPPGTGKTTTLVDAIVALRKEHGQVLVTAPSNAAVDLLAERLSEAGLNVVRVGNPVRVSERLQALTLDEKISSHVQAKEIRRLKKQAAEYRDLAHKYKRQFGREERDQRKALLAEARNILKDVEVTEQYIIDDVLGRADVITATLVGANHYTVRGRRYEVLVIDEAGQSLEPACWIPILKARKLVLAGDHCQLPPTIKSFEAAKQGLEKTLLEKLVAAHPQSVVLLEEQYRMNEAIMGFSSREFYEGKLKAHERVAHHLLFEGDEPLVFIDTAGCGYEEQWEGTGIRNEEEALFLLKHLGALIEQYDNRLPGAPTPTVAVIAPYKRQVETLRERLAGLPVADRLGASLSVNTIDSFQGQERDLVYISLTRSNSDNTIGFLSEVRRMNVAMTRARKKLVVIGDSATLSQFPFYADFIEYAQEVGGYHSAWEFMDQ